MALDGLRGLALVAVLLFHADGLLRGGYLGVDLFFVLSGYLITALLVAEHAAAGRIALGPFWGRRARRLLPALFVLLPVVAFAASALGTADDVRSLRLDALATLAYVANWRAIVAEKSYWDLFASPSLLEHTWSLSIEEQFYVAWPLVTAVCLRRGGRRALRATVAVLAAASALAMLVLYRPEAPSRVYLGTDTRAAAILAGAAFALVLPPTTRLSRAAARALDLVGLAAAAGLAAAWTKLDGQATLLYRGGFWGTELCALALVACAVAGDASLVGRALRVRPLVLVGTLSYGLYLWHWPVFVVLSASRTHLHGLPLQGLRFAVTLVAALASYHFVETPIRTGRLRFGRPGLVVPAAFALTVVGVVGATQARTLAPASAAAPVASVLRDASLAVVGEEPVAFRVLFVGDSSANALGWSVRGLQARGVAADLQGVDGCTMLGDTCRGAEWSTLADALAPDATVVVLGGAFMHGISLGGSWRKACHPGWDRRFEERLGARLSELAPTTRAVWVATVPYPLGPWETPAFHAETDCINAAVGRVVARTPGARRLGLGAHLCPEGACTRAVQGRELRPDGVHYDIEASRALAGWVLASLGAPLAPSAPLSPTSPFASSAPAASAPAAPAR